MTSRELEPNRTHEVVKESNDAVGVSSAPSFRERFRQSPIVQNRFVQAAVIAGAAAVVAAGCGESDNTASDSVSSDDVTLDESEKYPRNPDRRYTPDDELSSNSHGSPAAQAIKELGVEYVGCLGIDPGEEISDREIFDEVGKARVQECLEEFDNAAGVEVKELGNKVNKCLEDVSIEDIDSGNVTYSDPECEELMK